MSHFVDPIRRNRTASQDIVQVCAHLLRPCRPAEADQQNSIIGVGWHKYGGWRIENGEWRMEDREWKQKRSVCDLRSSILVQIAVLSSFHELCLPTRSHDRLVFLARYRAPG